jgi:transposase
MGYGHSLDLRRRIIEAVEAGAPAREAARRFEVSPSSAIKLVQRWRATGSYAPGQIGGQKQRRLSGREAWLHGVLASEPDVTLAELQRRLAEDGIRISLQAINDTLRALGYSYKKEPTGGGTRARRHRREAAALADLAELAEAGAARVHR